MEMSMAEKLGPGSQGRSQEHLMVAEMMELGSWPLGISQSGQKLEPKGAGSDTAQPAWNMTAIRPKKVERQQQMPRMSLELDHGDAHSQEYPSSFQAMKLQHDHNSEANILDEIDLEEIDGLELEVMRRQLQMITGRLHVLEDQGARWRCKEAVLFTLLMSACVANMWLWMHQ